MTFINFVFIYSYNFGLTFHTSFGLHVPVHRFFSKSNIYAQLTIIYFMYEFYEQAKSLKIDVEVFLLPAGTSTSFL